MSAPIEARRLSGEHIGQTVTAGRITGTLKVIEHRPTLVLVWLRPPSAHLGTSTVLAPTDVVTLTGTTPSEEGS